jgi:hypothetical protein
MAGLWDIPPPPQIGEASEDITFTSVGRALTRWEEFEVVFASLFSALVATEDSNAAAIRAYGSVITFRGRAEMVRAAAEVQFSLFRNSALEKGFRAFVNELTNHASARRNEIAHGVVRVTPIIKDYTVVPQYFLYPPYYASNKLQLNRIDSSDGRQMAWYEPKYIYSSVEINQFARSFSDLVPRLAVIMGPMLQQKAPKPPTSHRL